jgi:hypothetical protein
MSELGLVPDAEDPFAQLEDANGRLSDTRGRMFTRLGLSERSFLQVNERVVIEDGLKHRIAYAYYLISDEAEVWGYERDPTHTPADHRHDSGHDSYPCEPVSFWWAAERSWETYHDAESLSTP